MQVDLHLFQADVQGVGNLFVGQFFNVAEVHHQALLFGQLLDETLYLRNAVAAFHRLGGRGRLGTALLHPFQRRRAAHGLAPGLIE